MDSLVPPEIGPYSGRLTLNTSPPRGSDEDVMYPLGQAISAHFTLLDRAVLFGDLIFTRILGGALAGKPATIRNFFLGGHKLLWYAVSGSIIATETIAIIFVGVPAIVFRPEGNYIYLPLGTFGSLLARRGSE